MHLRTDVGVSAGSATVGTEPTVWGEVWLVGLGEYLGAVTPTFVLFPKSGYNRMSYSLKIRQIKYTFIRLIQLALISEREYLRFPNLFQPLTIPAAHNGFNCT
jgi:hypothetical protein